MLGGTWGSMNCSPSWAATKSCRPWTRQSALKQRSTNSFWNESSLVSHFPGNGSLLANKQKHMFKRFYYIHKCVHNNPNLWGWLLSKICLNPCRCLGKLSDRLLKFFRLLRPKMSCQVRSDNQLTAGLGISFAGMPPDKRNRHSTCHNETKTLFNTKIHSLQNVRSREELSHAMSICFLFIRMRAHRRKANISLCFSNKLRHTLLYRLKVKYLLMLTILCFSVAAGHT